MPVFKNIKNAFPIFTKFPNLAYLDNASTTQKPQQVIDRITDFYKNENANIHRGIYDLSMSASEAYEATRAKIANFIGAASAKNIIYTKGTTDGINIVAQSYLERRLSKGDEVLISAMEHHANLIPWQQLCQKKGATLKIVPINADGEIHLHELREAVSLQTKFLAITHISNTLGTINNVKRICQLVKELGIPVLIDGAQSAAHLPIDVQDLDCDFFVFSGHKIFGPTGIGVLYAKEYVLKNMEPILFGGGSIKNVTFEQTTFAEAPSVFEPGTPNIAGVLGLGAAIDFISQFDKNEIANYVHELARYAREQLITIEGLKLIGTAENYSGIVSFNLGEIHAHDVATFLNEENIAVRAGHHCTQPLMEIFEVPATVRASFTIYNTKAEIDRLVVALKKIKQSRNLKALYKTVILAHSKSPFCYEKNESASNQINAYNSLCGDRFDLYFDLENETIKNLSFHGFGCAISKASTSVLVKKIKGKDFKEAKMICQQFLKNTIEETEIAIEDEEIDAFSGARAFPGRLKCATLAWEELDSFLEQLLK